YPKGTDVTLTATPGRSSTFTGWSSSDAFFDCPGTGTCTVPMGRMRTVTATFTAAATTESLTIVQAGSGSGTVTDNTVAIDCGSSCTARYVKGTDVTLTATPEHPARSPVG